MTQVTPIRSLTPELRDNLQAVLTLAFEVDGLRRFATERLAFDDVKFADEVNFSQTLSQVVFSLVEVALHHNRLAELVLAVRDVRPNREDVRALVEAFGLVVAAAARPVTVIIPAVVREAVIRFNERLQLRQRQFGYLNAYKELHDLLHGLQDFHTRLESTVAAIRRPSGEPPDIDGITDSLSLWVVEAQESVRGTQFPKIPPRWIARFKQAVEDLKTELFKPDPATIEGSKLDRAVEVLAHLPAEEQKGLNARLVECAMSLETDELVDLMDRILTELGKAGAAGAETDDLRAGVGAFRVLCRGLTDLIADHNLCQGVDGALSEADGLPEVTPNRLSQWTEIKGWLEEIAGRHPGNLPDDMRANRPSVSARDFEEAAAAGDKVRTKRLFDQLEARFRHLFFNTDKTLLEVTRDLLAAARALDATIKRFQ